ncbi:tetratricopeptide repeat protein [Vibrio aerogenes]|uniref:tetratricopeptide repeat protein n=1 Tax=Vibrio aerogenes TaxID=92172 RepID=UPI001114C1C0|nr:hypothetical protein [Vibrio aerogenes]
MRKKLTLLSCAVLLAGCASGSRPLPDRQLSDVNRQEKVLIAAKNYPALIDFYQARLRQEESAVWREKLAKTYLDSRDPESALFTLRPLFIQGLNGQFTDGKPADGERTNGKRTHEPQSDSAYWKNTARRESGSGPCFFGELSSSGQSDAEPLHVQTRFQTGLQNKSQKSFQKRLQTLSARSRLIAASACMDLGQAAPAKQWLISILRDPANQAHPVPESGETANLLGIIEAQAGNYTQARDWFVLARRYFYADAKVKNNLALIDMLEGQDQQALQRLMTIPEPDQEDPQFLANLLLAMAKNGRLDYLKKHLNPSLTQPQINMVYQALQQAEVMRPSAATTPTKSLQPDTGGTDAAAVSVAH